MIDGSVEQPVAPEKADYSPGQRGLAALATFFVPFISLIVALVMRSSESNPTRRIGLRTWALVSAGWLAVGVIVGIIVIASASSSVARHQPSSNGPCIGGPATGATGTPVGNNKFRIACSFGGSTIIKFGN
jgi:hypothetical protein